MHWIYNISISVYTLFIRIASLFNIKARLWIKGREDQWGKFDSFNRGNRKVIWIHCASLGEFEQGRPVIEKLKSCDENYFILLTFFSPSGYEIRKNYSLADMVIYLPSDSVGNASRFIDKFSPSAAIFVKYEFWYNYFSELCQRKIPLFIVSARFRDSQIFFRWYGKWFVKMLKMSTHLFVQDNKSLRLLFSIGIKEATVTGDTRFDRVSAIYSDSGDIMLAKIFAENVKIIIAGSTWPPDEELLVRYINDAPESVRMIIAPHEIEVNRIKALLNKLYVPYVRFSEATPDSVKSAKVLIIDNIGMLSSLYRYGTFAYIGGGFGKGIHNILEPSAWGLPVLFSYNYEKFNEAVELISLGGAFTVKNYSQFAAISNKLLSDHKFTVSASTISSNYIKKGTGATGLIVDEISKYLNQ